MLSIFSYLADWLVALMGLSKDTRLGSSIHFFFEDTTKILVLLVIMIYVISFLRASLDMNRVKEVLEKRNKLIGYFIGATLGAVTPFCSCSSIPLFIACTKARVPIGITMSFLITSPIVNELVLGMLAADLGLSFASTYMIMGVLAGVIGGIFFDLVKSDQFLTSTIMEDMKNEDILKEQNGSAIMTMKKRHEYAKSEVLWIIKNLTKWIVFGVGLGAVLHGYLPKEFVADNFAGGQWWTVPASVFCGIPLYANAAGVVPTITVLIGKGLPIGTAMALMMSIVGASIPEFILLKKIIRPKMLLIFFLFLLTVFTCIGWTFNYIWGVVEI